MADDIRAEEWRAWDAMRAGAYFESARLFEPLAALGSETALLSLGWIHKEGHLGQPDLEKAISLWETAASAGSAKAKDYLGSALKDKGDLKRARAFFLEGAEQGDTTCMYRAGRMLVHGEGGPVDSREGLAWLTRAADGGDAFARSEQLYWAAQPAWEALEACDYLESARLFEPLAALGSETALLNLGWMHSQGHLGPLDLEKAISLWETAERAGSVKAKLHLGRAWKDKGELQRARTIFLEGAEQGYSPCMYWTGRMLVRGEGCEVDMPAGVAWLKRGAECGQVYCRRELFRLEIKDSPSVRGRLWVYCKLIWFVLSLLPGHMRDPHSPNYR